MVLPERTINECGAEKEPLPPVAEDATYWRSLANLRGELIEQIENATPGSKGLHLTQRIWDLRTACSAVLGEQAAGRLGLSQKIEDQLRSAISAVPRPR